MAIILSDNICKMDADKIYDKVKILKENNNLPMEFKNRIHMCNYLNIKNDSTGNARIAEDKYLAEIFNSYREKHKVIITDIYEDYKIRLNNSLCDKIKYKEFKNFLLKYGNTKIIGIYGIYVDGELVYIGSSSSIYTRVRDHCYQMYLENGYNDSKYIELHKYLIEGKDISFEIIDDTITEENRYEIEYQYIEKYKPILNTIGTTRNIPYIATLQPEIKHAYYNKKNTGKLKLIKQYQEQIEKYQNKIKELQEKIDLLEKELQTN